MAYYSSHKQRISEIEKELYAGKVIYVPRLDSIATIQNGQPTTQMLYDEIRYNHNSMTYETRSQTLKIQELERQIGEEQLKKIVAEEDEKTKLKNLIAYYYNK